MSKLKERVCKSISDTITKLSRDGKLIRRTANDVGVFIHDSKRSQFVKILADIVLSEKEILEGVSGYDLERLVFEALSKTQNKTSMQDRAAEIARTIIKSGELK